MKKGKNGPRPPRTGKETKQNSKPHARPMPSLNRSKGPDRRGMPAAKASLPKIRIDLYGVHAVREAILNPDRIISHIYVTEETGEESLEWIAAARQKGIKRPEPECASRAVFDANTPEGSVHQGLGLTCGPLPDIDLDDVCRSLSESDDAIFVMLDQVNDPHNLGAIMRSACAFGARGVIVQSRHTPDINPLIAKVACGAAEHIPVLYETNLARALERLSDMGFVTYGFDERGNMDLPDVPPSARSVIVLGAEGAGLRRLIRESCAHLVRLPTLPPIGSLNVSNAAAVGLYHFAKKG